MEVTNAKNTICNFKRLLGRRYHDTIVQQERELNAYSIVEGSGSAVNIEVMINGWARSLASDTVSAGELSQRTQALHSGTDHRNDVLQTEAHRQP